MARCSTRAARPWRCAENTVLDPNPPTLAFALPDVATGMTDVEEWESRAAATVLLETVKALTGQEAVSGFSGGQGKLNGSMAKALYVTLAADARMKSIEDEGSVTRDVLIGIFASVSGVTALWPVFEAFYLSGARWQNPYRIARFLRYVRILSPVAKSKVSKAIAVAAAVATVSLAARPSPDPQESKTKGATIALKSLAFYSDASKDCGAVCIRPDFDASPVLPEWTEGCTASQSAYWRVGADARPVLRLTLAVLALDAPTTVQVKATAQGDGLLGSLDAQNVTLAAVGDVTVDFPLAHHALGAADLGSHNVLFQWRAGDKLLGSTKHEVHVLAARPLSRWVERAGERRIAGASRHPDGRGGAGAGKRRGGGKPAVLRPVRRLGSRGSRCGQAGRAALGRWPGVRCTGTSSIATCCSTSFPSSGRMPRPRLPWARSIWRAWSWRSRAWKGSPRCAWPS